VPSTSDTAARAIRALIAEHELRAGQRLPPERELATRFAISRPALREGIRRLVEAGVLEVRHGSGTFVSDLDLAAIVAVRLQLEPFAAGLAAEHRTDEHLSEMDRLLAALRAGVGDFQAFADLDRDFHLVVLDAAGNPVLRTMVQRLEELTALSRGFSSPQEGARAAALRDLPELRAVIEARDGAAARRIMRRHLRAVGRYAVLGQRGAP
jgi:GntR family transcriptional repressor for pyruvate dehydrogenase complex